jgi:hypothetical protein
MHSIYGKWYKNINNILPRLNKETNKKSKEHKKRISVLQKIRNCTTSTSGRYNIYVDTTNRKKEEGYVDFRLATFRKGIANDHLRSLLPQTSQNSIQFYFLLRMNWCCFIYLSGQKIERKPFYSTHFFFSNITEAHIPSSLRVDGFLQDNLTDSLHTILDYNRSNRITRKTEKGYR